METVDKSVLPKSPATCNAGMASDSCPLGYKAHCNDIELCRKNDKLRFMCINMHKPKFKDDQWH